MKSTHDSNRKRVAEPVQVYLAASDRDRMERLVKRLGATKSDVLRQGLAALESQLQRVVSPGGPTPLPTFAGRGLQPGVDLDDTAALLDLMDRRDAPR